MANNTIRLLKGYDLKQGKEWEEFRKGDTIWEEGVENHPEELKRWSIDQEDEARKELAGLRCSYVEGSTIVEVTEYALEWFEADEDGEFVSGSDYDFAEIEQPWDRARRLAEEAAGRR